MHNFKIKNCNILDTQTVSHGELLKKTKKTGENESDQVHLVLYGVNCNWSDKQNKHSWGQERVEVAESERELTI